MTVPGRTFSSPAYRYGFQGQEKDDELKGPGNSLNYTFRMHDPRVGRFFARDPLEAMYPFYSPYQFSGNRLIDMIELEGLEPTYSEAAELANDTYNPKYAEINGWELYNIDIPGVVYRNDDLGFQSNLYRRKREDNSYEYAYATAGTDDYLDAIEDAFQTLGTSNQIPLSIMNADLIAKRLGRNRNLTFIGHSLGGALASANSLVTGDDGITFNAAGLSSVTKDKYDLSNGSKVGNITAFIVEGEAVDKYQSLIGLKAEGNIITIKNDNNWAQRNIAVFSFIKSVENHTMGETNRLLKAQLDKGSVEVGKGEFEFENSETE